ncbi:hypothetical protein B0F90DRAFT_1740911 [Multifurca ochricompacta]|uniref:Uncharacterized protein n=1 Tax=Multifurca ochricompacta TaxID=376703 RepID=A0AAD4QKJ7_9AGAM|nr:hypothetical protein B0F90DRAFT_1740911 [Multifurca ochricompacta]
MVFSAILLFFSFLSFVSSQQLITTTDQAGNTIIEQITTNAFGQPLTQILQTLPPGTSSSSPSTSVTTSPTTTTSPATTTAATTTATTIATTTQGQQGPVGQPGSTPVTPGGPTPFVYTTTDAGGNYITVSATFTPTFPSTVPYTPKNSGTILQYSDWLSQIGNSTSDLNQPVASQASNPASRPGVNHDVLLGAVMVLTFSYVFLADVLL